MCWHCAAFVEIYGHVSMPSLEICVCRDCVGMVISFLLPRISSSLTSTFLLPISRFIYFSLLLPIPLLIFPSSSLFLPSSLTPLHPRSLPSTEPLLLPPLHFLILHAPTSSTEIFMRCLAERGFVVGFTATSWLSNRNRHADT